MISITCSYLYLLNEVSLYEFENNIFKVLAVV